MKALALFSGGLDSTLAINMMMSQGIEVVAVSFLSLFGCKSTENVVRKNQKTADRFGFRFITHEFTQEQFKIIKNPKFGLGKNMNPCLDCHILMLKEAKKIMAEIGADFIVTGEVLGQRPKSQRRDTFPVIDKEADLTGLVLRPLCAKNLKETLPETNGWVDRSKLLGIGGRGRKTQIEMARSIGWEDFPTPAGGCLLTDLGYSIRLKRIINGEEIPPENEVRLLTIGRHFSIGDCRAIVGRRESENEIIENLAGEDDYMIQVLDCGSPITILQGTTDDISIMLASQICARYSDRKNESEVKVKIWQKSGKEDYRMIKPLSVEETAKYLIS